MLEPSVAAPASRPPETLLDLLDRAAREPQTGLRFVDRRQRELFHPWTLLRAEAAAVAGGLAALGVAPGERVALVYATEPDFFRTFFGVLLAGGVPVPLYPPVRLGRLSEYQARTAAMLEAAGCRLVLASSRIRRILGEAMAQARPALGCLTLEQLGTADARHQVFSADALALVQFSSGTTTQPKPVALSHRALLAQVRALDDHWRDPGDQPTGVSWLPLYHDMGLIGCVLPALELPSVMTLLPPEAFIARPALWLRTIGRYGATISVAPNFAYALALDKIGDEEMDGVDLSSWRYALCGAESVAPSVLRRFQERFARWGLRPEALTPVYGLSEAALAVTFGRLDDAFHTARFSRGPLSGGRALPAAADEEAVELASVGRPLPGFSIRTVGPRGEDLPRATVGRILVRGPSLMSGYLGRPDLTAEAIKDGWLDTGDQGFLDTEGRLFLSGRAKDVLILRGRNHDPAEVERAASSLPGARPGCAVAVTAPGDDDATESLFVFVEHAKDATRRERESLFSRVSRAVIEATGLATSRVFVLAPGTLPRTSSGKLRRRETLRRFADGTLDPPDAAGPLAMGRALLRSARAYRHAAGGEKA